MGADGSVRQIVEGGLIAILRLPPARDLLPVAQALRDGGITAIEIALTTSDAVEGLGAVRSELGRGVLLGAGAVLTAEAARDAVRAGAEFLASPTLVPAVIQAGRAAAIPVMPGAFTATEILRAWEAGASLVRIFPAGPVGPPYLRDLHASIPSIPLVAAGGVSPEAVGAFIQAGAAAVAAGEEMIPPELLVRRAWREISDRARAFTQATRRARDQSAHPVPPARSTEGPDTR